MVHVDNESLHLLVMTSTVDIVIKQKADRSTVSSIV